MSAPDPVDAPSPASRRVLIVYAHPEPRSLNGTLKAFMCEQLASFGHEVRVSDLYEMEWKSPVDGADFPARDPSRRLAIARDSGFAYVGGTQTADVVAEQEKLRWADLVILQFPLWWFSMPAILKGWVDRVYACGFAYGVGEHSDHRWGERYGEGVFKGKRAMLVVTTGGWDSHYSERGINGAMDDVLYPINHGVLYYPGFNVLPPFIVYRAGTLDRERVDGIQRDLQRRLEMLFTQAPIRYRAQNGGDYDIPALTLKPGRENAGQRGFDLHISADRGDHESR